MIDKEKNLIRLGNITTFLCEFLPQSKINPKSSPGDKAKIIK